ncbi:MAG: hypothetical protein WEA10_08290 [Actinomycetota bacterium]
MSSASTGPILIASGSTLILVAAFVLRTRIPHAYTMAVLAAAGVVLGTGGLLVQPGEPNLANWAVTVIVMAVMAPVHVHLVFGPPRHGATA